MPRHHIFIKCERDGVGWVWAAILCSFGIFSERLASDRYPFSR